MNLETFNESLQLAIQESFAVSEVQEQRLEGAFENFSRPCLEHLLTLIRLNQQPGLKMEVVKAMTDGREAEDRITVQREAYLQGMSGHIRKFARKKYQEIVKSETE